MQIAASIADIVQSLTEEVWSGRRGATVKATITRPGWSHGRLSSSFCDPARHEARSTGRRRPEPKSSHDYSRLVVDTHAADENHPVTMVISIAYDNCHLGSGARATKRSPLSVSRDSWKETGGE